VTTVDETTSAPAVDSVKIGELAGDAATDVASAHGAGVPVAAAVWGSIDVAGLLAAGPDAVLIEPSDLLTLCLAVYAG